MDCKDCVDDKCKVHCWRCHNTLDEKEKTYVEKYNEAICDRCGYIEYK